MGSTIISRVVVLALVSHAYALTPLSAVEDDSDCALYLNGPGRSTAYDYTLNLLKGNFGYEGQHTCITYDAVNQAYLEARNRIVVSHPKGEWKAEDFASVGELILDISINLAKRYGLTYEEIEKGLPLIDTSRTLIRDVCPPVFSHVECRAGKYRRLDGLCNNLEHPTWGATMSPFQRLIGPLFSDGINAPRIAHTGRDLPLSRVVSRTMHPDEGYHDHAGTVMVIAWGQFMDHDYTLTGTPLDPINRNDPEECCSRPQHLKHPYCNEIRVPDDDYFYRLWGVKCIDFVRAFPSPRPGCRLGSRVPFNTLTGALDGNTVYGVTEKFSRKLRTGFGGLLRMNPVFKEYGLKDLLPLKLDIPDEGCTRPNKNMYCFEGGEIRVNEQLVLTVMHTLMAREHNRVAKGLAAVNPHWDDETLFQEARRINVAEIQHITYNEFLPILLGKDVMEKFGLVLEKQGYWDGYDPNVNPDVIDAFASAAFRFGHSLLPTAVERWSKAHKFIASKRLSDLIRRPYDLYRAGVLDEYVMGLMNQVAQAMDDSITQEVTNHLFKKVGARFGMDLVSFNMQRGREFGIPGYMEFRKFCGLNGAETFQDLFGSMPNETVRKYETIFEHPIDVDLWSGGVSERPLPGSMLGPTFACVIATQFSYSRRGDRFWFELPNQPSSFTPEQLVELRKSRLSRVICDNTDIIDTVQLYPMVLPDHELNPRVPCRSGIIPSIDFSKWAEPAPFHGHSAGPFITEAFVPVKNQTGKDTQTENYLNNTNADSITTTVKTNISNDKLENVNLVTTEADQLNSCQNKTNQNCAFIATACSNCTNTSKEAHGPDRILKYVYKKNEPKKNEQKKQGHLKNSITRRRRSVNKTEGDTLPAFSAPLIVNYETLHEPQPFSRHTAEVIRGANLADFNIETIHDAYPRKNINEETSKISNDSESSSQENSSSDENDRKISYDITENDQDRKGQRQVQNEDSEENLKDLRKQSNDSGERSTEIKEGYKENGQINNPYRELDNRERNDKSEESFKHENDENSSEESDIPHKRRQNIRDRSQSGETNENSQESISRSSPYSKQRAKHSQDKDIPYKRRENIPEHRESGESNENSQERKSSSSPNSKHRTEKNIPYKRREKNREHKESNESNESSQESNLSRPYQQHRSNHSNNKKVPYQRRENIREPNESGETNGNSQESNTSGSPEHSEDSQESSYENNDHNRKKKPYDASTESNEFVNRPRSSLIQGQEQYSSRELDPIPHSKAVSSTSLNDEGNKSDYLSLEQDDNKYKKPTYDTPNSGENSAEDEESSKIREAEPLYSTHYVKPQSSNLTESGEQDIAITALKRKNFPNKEDKYQKKSSPLAIKDVDLGDFSYEQIQINKNGDVEPVSDTHENYDDVQSHTPTPTVQTEIESHKYQNSKPNENILFNIDANGRSAPIDDDEVKPVVEINPEQDENSREALKTEPNEDTSLESLLGVKNLNSDENSEKTSTIQETPNKGDVKQQFERIPLNYDHDKNNKEKIDSTEGGPLTPLPQDHQIKDDTNKNIDTNILTPLLPNSRYDDHLNYKFDDISIKLPEIKLPDDILAVHYDYKESPYKKLKNINKQPKQNKFYQYNDNEYHNENDNDDEEHKNIHRHDEHVNHDDHKEVEEDDGHVNSHGYHDYYEQKDKKAPYKQQHDNSDDEDSDEEDLYEKFVRERFGKKGSFEKRAARLEDSRPAIENAKLFESLQKVLKKAQNIEKDAKKSGDPNAGYAWTLEYGQKL